MQADIFLDFDDGQRTERVTGIVPLSQNGFESWRVQQSPVCQNWIEQTNFKAESGSVCLIPDTEGRLVLVLLGMGTEDDLWTFGGLPDKLPPGHYRIDTRIDNHALTLAALAWSLGAYSFERYKAKIQARPRLVIGNAINRTALEIQLRSIYLVRDLINTPAADMMPQHLAQATQELAAEYGARVNQIVGEELLAQNYPIIHAVGRASAHAPRLIDLTWGNAEHPKVTLVGKGVCFDSGGLDIKPASAMRLMKKDMGGAAHVLGLARMVMEGRLPVRLRVLIAAVENAVSSNAFRPGDVLTSRQGLTIEVDNTDAEGRLVLCDALTEAAGERPVLIIDFATLTGAARTALGTEVPALFANNASVVKNVMQAAEEVDEPVWPLPLHRPYRALLDSTLADIANSSKEPYAGAITAALFLQEFVPAELDWVHFDVMGWNIRNRAAHPEGGEAMGVRAVFLYLKNRFENSS
jgi:leucyl aminopeptidase